MVPVNGKLVVYAYDDGDPNSSPNKPTRKYAFTAEQLTQYYGDSDLGASYNIWIPWDNVGGEEKQISLFPVFMDDSGQVVKGSFVNNRLPGVRKPTESERRGFFADRAIPNIYAESEGNVQQASFQENQLSADAAPKSGLKTTTIRIPRSMKERMAVKSQVMAQGSHLTAGPQQSWSETLPGGRQIPMQQPNQMLPPPSSYVPPVQPPTYPYNQGAQTSTMQDANVQPTAHLGQNGYAGVNPQDSVSGQSRAWARQDPRSAHFERPKFRVPVAPGVPSRFEHGRSQLPR